MDAESQDKVSLRQRLRFLARGCGRFLKTSGALFPLTWTGLLFAALSGLALWLEGVGQLDMVLLAAGFIGATLVALMVLLVAGASIATRLRWRHSGTRQGLVMECGMEQDTGFHVPLPRRLPLLEYAWSWESPPEVEVAGGYGRGARGPKGQDSDGGLGLPGERSEVIRPRRRGAYPRILRRVALADALGLASVSWTAGEAQEVRFLPARGALDQMSLLEGLTGGDDLSDPRGTPDGDRVDMRQYVTGDSPRMILWKVYARTRKLLVRVPERAAMTRPRSCAYLVAGEGDEPGAGLMRVILERGFLGDDWRFGADGSQADAARLNDALDILIRSGSVPPGSPTTFPEFLKRAQKDGFSACVVVVPPVEGPWIEAVVSALAGTLLRVHIYTVVDRVLLEAAPAKAWGRFLYVPEAGRAPRAEEMARMARHFTGRPFPFLLVDRQAGKVFGDVRALTVKRAALREARR